MRRSTTLFLPWILLVLASCGTPAQYSQQQFQDGLYLKPGEEPENVRLYTEEEFEAMAAANIARKQKGSRDTLVVVLDDPWGYTWRYPYYSYAPWVWGGLGFGTYFWHRWRYDPWFYDPWYGGYGFGWYDPWYAGWYDPWFYDPWYYGPGGYHYGYGYGWYDRYYYGVGRGGGFRRNTVYTPRYLTEGGSSRTARPGSGTNYRYGGAAGSGGSTILRGGQGTTVRRSRSSVSGSSSSSSAARSGNSSGYNYSRSREQGYNYSRSYGNNSGSGTTGSGPATRSYSGGNNSGAARSSGGGFSGGGGGGYSGGGASHSSGGGGGSRGGGRR